MVVRTLVFVLVRRVLGLVGLDSAPDARDIEIAVLRHQLLVLRRRSRSRWSVCAVGSPPAPYGRSSSSGIEPAPRRTGPSWQQFPELLQITGRDRCRTSVDRSTTEVISRTVQVRWHSPSRHAMAVWSLWRVAALPAGRALRFAPTVRPVGRRPASGKRRRRALPIGRAVTTRTPTVGLPAHPGSTRRDRPVYLSPTHPCPEPR